jgi:hypothetical protein
MRGVTSVFPIATPALARVDFTGPGFGCLADHFLRILEFLTGPRTVPKAKL